MSEIVYTRTGTDTYGILIDGKRIGHVHKRINGFGAGATRFSIHYEWLALNNRKVVVCNAKTRKCAAEMLVAYHKNRR